jgi:hypothetical protein
MKRSLSSALGHGFVIGLLAFAACGTQAGSLKPRQKTSIPKKQGSGSAATSTSKGSDMNYKAYKINGDVVSKEAFEKLFATLKTIPSTERHWESPTGFAAEYSAEGPDKKHYMVTIKDNEINVSQALSLEP